MNDTALPPVLRELHQLDFDPDGDGFDFEPYAEFDSSEATSEWFRLWTGNPEADGSVFRVFGQDGSGGHAAMWCVRDGESLEAQPIVFLGSEGEVGVVARNLADYLWLLADGLGPAEAVGGFGAVTGSVLAPFRGFAEANAAAAKKEGREALAQAQSEFPDFEAGIESLCR